MALAIGFTIASAIPLGAPWLSLSTLARSAEQHQNPDLTKGGVIPPTAIRQEAARGWLIDGRLEQDVPFLDTTVDDAYGGCALCGRVYG